MRLALTFNRKRSDEENEAEFDTIAGTLGTVLEEAGERMRVAA